MATTTNLDTLKINYLTQAQYDTALANSQINENELYMTPVSSSGGGSESLVIALTTNGWVNDSQTVTANGVTANNDILISPPPTSAEVYFNAGIICTAQASNSLTFTCSSTPSESVDVNILIFS